MSAAMHPTRGDLVTHQQRTCAELGVCQAKLYPCTGCTHVLDAIERERKLQQDQQDAARDAADTPSITFEQVIDWIAYAATCAALVMTVLFLIGFVGWAGVKLGLIA